MAVILPQSMQADLQTNLPIIPNNGNPGGAYNMSPQDYPVAADKGPQDDRYGWLKPSKYMEDVNVLLKQQDNWLEEMLYNLSNERNEGKYNIDVDNKGFNFVPLNDNEMTMGINHYDSTPVSYPINNGVKELPSYLPVLPGE